MAEAELVEAVLFSKGEPMRVADIVEASGLEEAAVRKALKKLTRSYKTRTTAIEIAKIGAKFSMQLREEYAQETEPVAKKELGHEVLKTAALIAYYQPMKKRQLIDLLGETKAKEHVKELLAKRLIYENRTNRGFILETTPKFFEFFGLEMTKKEELKQLLAEKAGL